MSLAVGLLTSDDYQLAVVLDRQAGALGPHDVRTLAARGTRPRRRFEIGGHADTDVSVGLERGLLALPETLPVDQLRRLLDALHRGHPGEGVPVSMANGGSSLTT